MSGAQAWSSAAGVAGFATFWTRRGASQLTRSSRPHPLTIAFQRSPQGRLLPAPGSQEPAGKTLPPIKVIGSRTAGLSL
jgi:hypothetical protein